MCHRVSHRGQRKWWRRVGAVIAAARYGMPGVTDTNKNKKRKNRRRGTHCGTRCRTHHGCRRLWQGSKTRARWAASTQLRGTLRRNSPGRFSRPPRTCCDGGLIPSRTRTFDASTHLLASGAMGAGGGSGGCAELACVGRSPGVGGSRARCDSFSRGPRRSTSRGKQGHTRRSQRLHFS